MSVADDWAFIERWGATHHPTLELELRPPSTKKAIAAAEKTLGVRFPDGFRASLLVHDGQEDHPGLPIIPFAMRLGSLVSLTKCWKDDRRYVDEQAMKERFEWLDDSNRVRQVDLHPKQVPIAGSPFWDYGRLLIDFVPGPEGREGQIIARDDINLVFVCDSFEQLVHRTAEGLENGSITVEPTEHDSGLVYWAGKRTKKRVQPWAYFSAR